MSSIFTKIIAGLEPAHKVWEGQSVIAILDTMPVNAGHLLVIPHEEVEYIFDLHEARYNELWSLVRFLSTPLKLACSAPKIAVAVEGFGVPHIHIHMVPVYKAGELNPERATTANQNDLAKMCQKIRKQIHIQDKK